VKPRLLDLFCGAGGATRGYQDAGFYVVGVDLRPQPHYCGDEFIWADALEIPLGGFAAIHASPPCQAYTSISNRWRGAGGKADSHPDLIWATRVRLLAAGVPWVLENVPGARRQLRGAIRLTGEMFGLAVSRPRLFECCPMVLAPAPRAKHRNPVAVYGKHDQRRLWTRKDGSELRCADLETAKAGMGIDWMDWDELKEAIPPAYTHWIGRQLLQALECAA
jgi:DNA (cytosine-5)-methyltransferase 1